MIAARNFTHNGARFRKGRPVNLPAGELAVLEGLGFVKNAPPRKTFSAKSAD